MSTQLIRHTVLLCAVVAVGVMLSSLELIRRVDVGRWPLDTLVAFTTFTLASMIAVTLAQLFQTPQGRASLKSPLIARALSAVGYGLTAWMLTRAVGDVLVPAWVKVMETVFAVVVISLAGYVLWIVFTGFDEIARALRGVPSVAQAPLPTDTAPVHCTQCGTAFQAGQKFCGSCGAPRG